MYHRYRLLSVANVVVTLVTKNSHKSYQNEYSGRILVQLPSMKFEKNLPNRSRVVSYGRSDGRTDDVTKQHNRFSQLCFRASNAYACLAPACTKAMTVFTVF